ncbi:MAG: caspase family protein [Epsilonproteobacteria bacterium]|nr:caspase family protein [Campylobacterota bacterium]
MVKDFIKILFLILGVIFIQACKKDVHPVQSKGSENLFSKSADTQKVALVVGISNYAGDRADLGGIERDVDKMKRLFQNWGFDVKVLYNEDSMQIVDHLSQYGNSLNSEDFFAFYYSGHGSHKRDQNGDEADNNDETLVLSDGKVNKHLIDDILYAKFNGIKAKKMVFFDSCHSGTVFRSLNGKTQSKTIRPEDVTKSFAVSKGMKVEDTISKESDYVVLSSSQDHEESLATPTGSLFTNAVYEVFSDSSAQHKSFNDINDVLTQKVLNYASQTDGKPHHPNINFSSSSIGDNSLQNYITKKSINSNTPNVAPVYKEPTVVEPSQTAEVTKVETLQETLDSLIRSNKLKSMSLDYHKSIYKTGELVQFGLNTQSDRGFLTIFYVDGNDVTVLYPNPYIRTQELQGRYRFPDDLSNGKFDIEAYKSCEGCEEEKTTIYTLLSSEPISNIREIQSKGLVSFAKNSKESKIMSRAVRVKATTKTATKSSAQLGKYEFIVK